MAVAEGERPMSCSDAHGPVVDIALATYQGAKYLEEQLRSYQAQTWPRFRIFASDDGSRDETVAILSSAERYLPIKTNEDQRRKGVAANFSLSIATCTADYVALSDQDDVWHPEKLGALVEAAVAVEREVGHQTPVLVFSDLEIVDSSLRGLSGSFFKSTVKSAAARSFRDFVITNHAPGCAMLFNRALLDRAMPIPDVDVHDHWLVQVAALFGRVAYVDRPLIKYRQHSANVIGLGAGERVLTRMKKTVHRLAGRPGRWRRQAASIRRSMDALQARFGDSELDPEDRFLIRTLADGRSMGAIRRLLDGAAIGERRIDYLGILVFLAYDRVAGSKSRRANQ